MLVFGGVYKQPLKHHRINLGESTYDFNCLPVTCTCAGFLQDLSALTVSRQKDGQNAANDLRACWERSRVMQVFKC